MALEEALDLPCPFTGQKRADRVDEVPARANQLGRNIEQSFLDADDSVEAYRSRAG